MNDELYEDNPLWLVNEQIKGLLEGEGASEDHKKCDQVLARHRAAACAEVTKS